MAITDHVSVMRRGEMVATEPSDTSVGRTGRTDGGPPRAAARRKGPGQSRRSGPRVSEPHGRTGRACPASTMCPSQVRKGEIVGIAGVSGNGQSELLERISGHRQADLGRDLLEGKDLGVLGDPAPRARTRASPMSRRTASTAALINDFDACGIAILGWHYDEALGRGFRLDREAVVDRAEVRKWRTSTSARRTRCSRAPNSPAATSRRSSSRARSERDPDSADRRPADARRRHRRHRIHPQAPHRTARPGQGHPAGVGGTR